MPAQTVYLRQSRHCDQYRLLQAEIAALRSSTSVISEWANSLEKVTRVTRIWFSGSNRSALGYFAEVRRAEWRGTKVAVKIIYRENFRNKNELELFQQEAD